VPYAWVYVINTGAGTPNVVRGSHSATTVVQTQPGAYVVTFPSSVSALTCVATLNNSVGTITAVPGDNSGLAPNQVRVVTLTLQNQGRSSYDFSLAVFYSQSRLPPRPPVATSVSRRKKRPRGKRS
jgi:hypothetical protein